MRFRTGVTNVSLLHKIGRSLSALAKVCVIRLSLDKVHFIIPGHEGREGVQVWSSCQTTLFSGYRIESNNDNEIWLEVNLDALIRVLRSADTSAGISSEGNRNNATALSEAEVTLKLQKNGRQPVWQFEIRGKSLHGKDVEIKHDINVAILSSKRQGELLEPMCPPPDIHIVMPNLTELKNIVARLGHLADDVKISANHEGTLEMTVKSNHVDITTTWRNLELPSSTTDQDQSEHSPHDRMFSTSVSIKGLQKFLTSHLIGGTAIACLCENHCIIAYVYIGSMREAGGVLTFFVPAKIVE
ncbi:DNA damage checkpoint control protein [Cryptotrichosporon argae]